MEVQILDEKSLGMLWNLSATLKAFFGKFNGGFGVQFINMLVMGMLCIDLAQRLYEESSMSSISVRHFARYCTLEYHHITEFWHCISTFITDN